MESENAPIEIKQPPIKNLEDDDDCAIVKVVKPKTDPDELTICGESWAALQCNMRRKKQGKITKWLIQRQRKLDPTNRYQNAIQR